MISSKYKKHKIICIGDSITYGYPWGPNHSWVYLLQQKGFNLTNKGVNGDTTLDMLRRFEQDVLNLSATHVHILGGANDAWTEFNLDESKHCIDKMVKTSLGQGIQPILGLPTPLCTNPIEGGSFFPFGTERLTSWLQEFRKWLHEYTKLHSILLIDYFNPLCVPGTTKGDERYFYDECHLNNDGNALIAAEAKNALINML